MVSYLIVFMHDQIICTRKLSKTPSVPVYRTSKRKPDCSKFAVTRAFLFCLSVLKRPCPVSMQPSGEGSSSWVFVHVFEKDLCVFRPAVSQHYNPGAGNMSGPHPSYPQHYGPPPTMQQVTNQMTGMQINSGPPTPAGPGYGKCE